MKFVRLAAALAALGLVACGGGGGGGGGDFTLTPSAASFTASPGGALPAPIRVRMHLTDDKAWYYGGGYVDVPVPDWLSYSFEVVGERDIDVVIWPHTTGLPEGTYTTVLTVGTGDKQGDVLQTHEIPVAYTLDQVVDMLQGDVTHTFTFGHDDTHEVQPIAVSSGAGDTYVASSSAAWLTVPDTVYTGTGYVYADIDASGLAIGQYTGTVTVQNTDAPGEHESMTVTVNVVAPQLDVDTASVLLGGSNGLSSAAGAIRFAVDTGTKAHPWTATLTTDDGAEWLLADGSGDVAGAGLDLVVDANRSLLPGGTYTGSVKLDVDVDGYPLSATVPVTLNKEAERLLVASDGVALVQLPSREVLTRDIEVRTTQDRAGVEWTATSDQAWLEVTPSGVTGGGLTLTANPLLLAQDTLHAATVTVESGDPTIENTQSIRVGLWVGSADPALLTLPGDIRGNVMSPVAPIVYTHTGTNLITAYNVYTGAVATTFAAGTSYPGGMAMSTDGSTLFVRNTSAGSALAIDVATGTVERTYTPPNNYGDGSFVAYGRTDALPTVYLSNGFAADAATGEFFGTYVGGGLSTLTADGRFRYSYDTGYSPASGVRAELRRTVLHGGGLQVVSQYGIGYGSNGQDVAVAPDNSRFYLASGSPYAFPAFNGATRAFIAQLPGYAYPTNAEVAWNGVFAGGSNAYYDNIDLWFYDPAGEPLGTLRCAGTDYSSLIRDSVRFSGDALRVSCITSSSYGGGQTLRIHDVPGS